MYILPKYIGSPAKVKALVQTLTKTIEIFPLEAVVLWCKGREMLRYFSKHILVMVQRTTRVSEVVMNPIALQEIPLIVEALAAEMILRGRMSMDSNKLDTERWTRRTFRRLRRICRLVTIATSMKTFPGTATNNESPTTTLRAQFNGTTYLGWATSLNNNDEFTNSYTGVILTPCTFKVLG